MGASLEDARLKALLKETLIELLEERREEFSELLMEVLEDLGMYRAIKEGEDSAPVKKEEILRIMVDQV